MNAVYHGLPTTHDEVPFKRSDGQIIDLSVATSFLEIDECRPGFETVVAVFRDITAFKNLERIRRRAVDHLSHELKTPLSIIAASVEMLKNNRKKRNISAEKLHKDKTQSQQVAQHATACRGDPASAHVSAKAVRHSCDCNGGRKR